MRISTTARLLRALALAGGALALSWSAQAQSRVQNGSAPSGLNWKWMNEAVFNSRNLPSSATAQERALAANIWATQLQQLVVIGTGQRAPSFVLVGTAEKDGGRYVFTMFTRAGTCENPPNGSAGAEQMYAKCPLRVTMFAPDGQSRSQDFEGYCYLNLDDSDAPRAKNHTEVAFDRRTSTAYFRTIQHGKTVPQCNRSIRLAAK